MGVCNCSLFCCTLLCVPSSIAIILMGKGELVALLNLSSWCPVMVERLFLAVPQGCLRFVIMVFPDHTQLLFFMVTCWERANLLALLYVMFSCIYVTFPVVSCVRCDTWFYIILNFPSSLIGSESCKQCFLNIPNSAFNQVVHFSLKTVRFSTIKCDKILSKKVILCICLIRSSNNIIHLLSFISYILKKAQLFVNKAELSYILKGV